MTKTCPDCGGRLDRDEVLGLVCVECERVVEAEGGSHRRDAEGAEKATAAESADGADGAEEIKKPEIERLCPRCGIRARRYAIAQGCGFYRCNNCKIVFEGLAGRVRPEPLSLFPEPPPRGVTTFPENFPCVIVPVLPDEPVAPARPRLFLSGEEGGRRSAYFQTGDPAAGLGVVVSVQWFGKTTLEVASAARRVADQLGVELEEGS